jgi:hypothetical protein
MSEARKGGDRRWRWAFAALCLVAGSRWIFADEWPQTASSLQAEAVACWIAALLAFAVAGGRLRTRPDALSGLKLLAIGGGLLAAPALGAVFTGPASEPFNRTVALCFVPIIVAVLSGIWSGDAASSSSLWPGLAGLGGALLVFPLVLPSGMLPYIGLLIPPIAVGAACAACRSVSREVAAEWSAALLFAGGGICLALMETARLATSHMAAPPLSAWAVGINLLLVALTVFVVLQAEAAHYVSRYFVIPLLTIVEGVLIFRSGITLRLCVGMALLVVSTVVLVRVRGTDAESSQLRLR